MAVDRITGNSGKIDRDPGRAIRPAEARGKKGMMIRLPTWVTTAIAFSPAARGQGPLRDDLRPDAADDRDHPCQGPRGAAFPCLGAPGDRPRAGLDFQQAADRARRQHRGNLRRDGQAGQRGRRRTDRGHAGTMPSPPAPAEEAAPPFIGSEVFRGSSTGARHPLRVSRLWTVLDLACALARR